jgi:hypothetical protein
MSLNDEEPMTDEKRQKIIIEYIKSNKFCNKQRVVKGVENRISRRTVFRILHKLIEEGAINIHVKDKKKQNARDHQLVVNEDNPFVFVPLELEEFEKAYFNLVDKVFFGVEPKLRQAIAEEEDLSLADQLGSPASLILSLWDIFYSMVDAYLFRFLFVFSQEISDQHVLKELYSMVFLKIVDMQIRLSERFTRGRDTNLIMEQFLHLRLSVSAGAYILVRQLESFKKVGLEKEIEPVIDSHWKIFGELQSYAYPEPQEYHWHFKYGKDDWRKIVNLYSKSL